MDLQTIIILLNWKFDFSYLNLSPGTLTPRIEGEGVGVDVSVEVGVSVLIDDGDK
jgi:hypothetical protein